MKDVEKLFPVMRGASVAVYKAIASGKQMDSEAIAEATGLQRHPTVTKEISALHKAGLIHVHAIKKVNKSIIRSWATGQESKSSPPAITATAHAKIQRKSRTPTGDDIEAFMSRARKRKLAEHNRTFKPTRDRAASWI